jgi:type 1 glutamine amidotransferase
LKHIMILNGGWPDHNPEKLGDFLETCIVPDYRVSRASDLNVLRPDILSRVDVLVLIWTYGEITDKQIEALIHAVQRGMGLMAWHGATSAFLANRPYKFLLGGQFVDHPGGDQVAYRVHFSEDPLTKGIADIDVVTEQNYYLIDPAVKILAKTHIQSKDKPWIYGVEVPVAWKRDWGAGKVFYCALGHKKVDIDSPSIKELISRAVRWLSRGTEV